MSRPNRLLKKCFFVITRSPRRPRDLFFFVQPNKRQIPRANPALRNDSLRVFAQPVQPCRWATRYKLASEAATHKDYIRDSFISKMVQHLSPCNGTELRAVLFPL